MNRKNLMSLLMSLMMASIMASTPIAVADNTTASVTVQEEAPVVVDIYGLLASYDPTSNSTTAVTFTFNATDNNENFDSGRAKITASGVDTGWIACSDQTGSGALREFACSIDMQYYYDAQTYTVTVEVNDTASNSDDDTDTTDYTTLVDIIIPSTVAFGSVSLGEQNVSSGEWQIWNVGNANLNLSIQGADLVGQTTPAQNISISQFSIDDDAITDEGAETDEAELTLTDSSQRYPDASLVGGSGSNDSVWYYLDVPASSLSQQVYQATWIYSAIES